MPDSWDFRERMMMKHGLTLEQTIEFINDVVMQSKEAELAVQIRNPEWSPVDRAMVEQEHGAVVSLARGGMR